MHSTLSYFIINQRNQKVSSSVHPFIHLHISDSNLINKNLQNMIVVVLKLLLLSLFDNKIPPLFVCRGQIQVSWTTKYCTLTHISLDNFTDNMAKTWQQQHFQIQYPCETRVSAPNLIRYCYERYHRMSIRSKQD